MRFTANLHSDKWGTRVTSFNKPASLGFTYLFMHVRRSQICRHLMKRQQLFLELLAFPCSLTATKVIRQNWRMDKDGSTRTIPQMQGYVFHEKLCCVSPPLKRGMRREKCLKIMILCFNRAGKKVCFHLWRTAKPEVPIRWKRQEFQLEIQISWPGKWWNFIRSKGIEAR